MWGYLLTSPGRYANGLLRAAGLHLLWRRLFGASAAHTHGSSNSHSGSNKSSTSEGLAAREQSQRKTRPRSGHASPSDSSQPSNSGGDGCGIAMLPLSSISGGKRDYSQDRIAEKVARTEDDDFATDEEDSEEVYRF